jgi:diguanylate cyclase (GGDEF)-like protein
MNSSDATSVPALFRLVAARLEFQAIGAFVLDGDRARLWSSTEALQPCLPPRDDPDASLAIELPDTIRSALEAGGAVRVDPASLGLRASYAVLEPIRAQRGTAGFLLLADGRRRWLSPKLTAGMRDAAILLAALLGRRPAAAAADGGVTARILPLADAQRMIGSERARTGRSSAVLLLDMDRFRAINAALGAPAGDSLLAITATRLERSIGASERLARLDADRFLILSTRPDTELPDLARRLLASVGEPLSLAGRSVVMQATIGLVGPQPAGVSDDTLFMLADTALRRGKLEGGNRVVLHEPRHNAMLHDRSRLELDLGKAVDRGQLRLVYQPYVSLDSDRVEGVEALLRWDHPERGELMPSEFIEIAESSGQILLVGAWALRTALCQATDWPGGTRLSVNISPLEFHQPDFTARVDAALAVSGFPADRLELEITETLPMRTNAETIGQIRTLIARGIRIALDDFGTGYTALAYLARLPHHRIKLDHSFVQDLANPATRDLIRAIVASARAQGVAITAEGVETLEQLEEVRAMGFTHAQGFVTGGPVTDPMELIRAQQIPVTV